MKFRILNLTIGGHKLYIEDGSPKSRIESTLEAMQKAMIDKQATPSPEVNPEKKFDFKDIFPGM